MKRHHWFERDGNLRHDLIVVNGGADAGGWWIKRRSHEPGAWRQPRPWRRYYPPGYDGLLDSAAVLSRYEAGGDWWVEWISGHHAYDRVGPFPNKASAWTAWKVLTS